MQILVLMKIIALILALVYSTIGYAQPSVKKPATKKSTPDIQIKKYRDPARRKTSGAEQAGMNALYDNLRKALAGSVSGLTGDQWRDYGLDDVLGNYDSFASDGARADAVGAESWAKSSARDLTGKEWGDFPDDDARDAAVTEAASRAEWEQSGGQDATGTEWGEFGSEKDRSKALEEVADGQARGEENPDFDKTTDTDGDGTPDYKDSDDDNDGVPDDQDNYPNDPTRSIVGDDQPILRKGLLTDAALTSPSASIRLRARLSRRLDTKASQQSVQPIIIQPFK